MDALSGVRVRPAAGRRGLLLFLLLAAQLAFPPSAAAQAEPSAAEHQVKAAYLYKFLGFVEWPARSFESAESPFVIGVVGADELATELAQVVAQRHINGRPAVARRMRPGDPLTGLHMLFVGRGAGARTAGLLGSARQAGVLTVTETDEAFAAGSAINFVLVDNRVRFDVALAGVDPNELKISSRLLGVARRVKGPL